MLASAIISGIGLGSMYGLIALGFHITYVVSNTVKIPALNPAVTNASAHKLQLQLPGVPAARYVLQATTNLVAPNWQPIATNPADVSGNATFSDTNTAVRSFRFYRATIQ